MMIKRRMSEIKSLTETHYLPRTYIINILNIAQCNARIRPTSIGPASSKCLRTGYFRTIIWSAATAA